MEKHVIEIRCPVGPRRLFTKLVQSGEVATITNDNLIEFACTDCRKALKRTGRDVHRVLHRYNLAGELVTSLFTEE